MLKIEVLLAVVVDARGSPRTAPRRLSHEGQFGFIVTDCRYEGTRFCSASNEFDGDASVVIASCKGAEVELKLHFSDLTARHSLGVPLESVQ